MLEKQFGLESQEEETNTLLDSLYEVNKKVVNAKKHIYDSIKFDSALEVNCYKLLKEADIPFMYNSTTFDLTNSFRLNHVNLYETQSNKEFKQYFTKGGDKQKFRGITLTPDFHILMRGYLIFIETKGYPNELYPYKKKLLLEMFEREQTKAIADDIVIYKSIYYFEPKNVKQIKESIRIIKEIKNEENRTD